MDQDIYALVGKYGFKSLHSRLTEIMKSEFEYLKIQFPVQQAPPPAAALSPPPIAAAPAPSPPPPPPPPPIAAAPVAKKRPYKKKSAQADPLVVPATLQVEQPAVVSETPEIKDVLVVAPPERSGYRDPKEVKAFQKASEDERMKLNQIAGIQLSQILTKENLKQWIEVEGRTYAWVAREKAGCPDTQVAATAQMMGLKSTISRKRGIIMQSR